MGKRHRRELEDTLARAVSSSPLVRRLNDEVQWRYRRSRRRRKRSLRRFLISGLVTLFVTFVGIPALMVLADALGFRWWQNFITAGLVAVLSYAAIIYFTFVRKRVPPAPALAKGVSVAQLPAQTDDWLDQQRHFLPFVAQGKLDSIAARLETLAPQVSGMDDSRPGASELKRLLAEELPELVRGYLKVPRALQTEPLHGGLSPEKQLIEGLGTIDEQIGRLQEQLAADDLRALATHQRYLDLKYKRDDELK